MTTAKDFARRANYKWMGGYIVTDEEFPQIVGRVFSGDGDARYQIAARPHDETSVGPFADRQIAFNECVKILESRITTGYPHGRNCICSSCADAVRGSGS